MKADDIEDGASSEYLGSDGVPTAAYGKGTVGPGAQIGWYKLLPILGEGGYGIVYLAEQQRPVKRRAALKGDLKGTFCFCRFCGGWVV